MKSFKLFGSSDTKKDSEDTKKCQECLADIPKKANKCSHCGSKQKGQYGVKHLLLGLFIIILLPLLLVGDNGDSSSTQQHTVSETNAYVIAQNYVGTVLKSPSTADFPLLDYQSSNLGGNKYKVVSYVDAQNSFGAEIRSNYSVTLSYNEGEWADRNNWTLHELIFDGETVFTE